MPEGKSVQSLSTELNPFCQCNEVKSFSEVRQQIINSQGTTCPKCNTRFRHVTIETRTLPISHYLCSCSGLMVLLASLFSFSPLIYIALLAYVEIHISSKADVIEDYSSMTLFIVLTVGFTFYLLFRFGQTCFDWLSELADQVIICNVVRS